MNFSTNILFVLFSIITLVNTCNSQAGIQTTDVKDSTLVSGQTNSVENEIDEKIGEIIAKMSLADKVGEMTQLSIDAISVGRPYRLRKPHELDLRKMQEILVDYKVGSILNAGGHSYTKEYWHEIISKIQDYAVNKKASGIPVLYGIDAIHGASYTLEATLFPQQIAQAATWNPELTKEAGRITAYETRASSIPWTFSPVLDIGRDPRWPRLWETFGEDVHLSTEMGKALVKGYEGDENQIGHKESIAACLKHFLGYSVTLSGKDRSPAWIPERQLREYFLPTFQGAIEAGAHTIMICSGEINGIPVHANKKILTDLLKNELGFKGIVLTDWEDIKYLYSRHRVAKGDEDAVKMAVNAGIDMSMVPMDLSFTKTLKKLVEKGEVPMSRIDDAVSRILRTKIKLGLFENPTTNPKDYPKFGSEEHITASYKTAQEVITLLKNDKKILPLSKSDEILVTGPTANSLNYLNGGWTHTWQGADPQWNNKGKRTIVEAIQDKIGEDKVTYLEGTTINENRNIQEVAAAAKGKKAAIICIGESTYTETPGNIGDLALPQIQRDLVKAIAKTGTPIVLVLVEGRPRIIADIEKDANGVLMAYLPGNEGGRAIADVLFGDVNPSGKLPYTYPREPHSLLTYDYKGTDQIYADSVGYTSKSQYEFGFGLSYTTFEYSNLKISSKTLAANASIELIVDVKNTGNRLGKEVVQLYSTDWMASITPSIKRLRAFKKIELKAGESKTVSFTITPKDLAFIGVDNKWITEPGKFTISIDKLKKDFHFKGTEPILFN